MAALKPAQVKGMTPQRERELGIREKKPELPGANRGPKGHRVNPKEY